VMLEETDQLTEGDGPLPPELRSKLSFGALQPHTSAWEASKAECCGVLEKLASRSTLSFRSYELCVWQERYVYTEDDALCYRQVNKERTPVGAAKRIPFAVIQFVGPFDDAQFVIKCAKRSNTFLTESAESRAQWIRNLSQLAGCSASMEVCRHTARGK